MNDDTETIRIVFLIMGAFDILLGFVIKKYQLADIVAGFNPYKHDKKRTTDIVGSNFMLMGILMILITVIYFFVPTLNISNGFKK